MNGVYVGAEVWVDAGFLEAAGYPVEFMMRAHVVERVEDGFVLLRDFREWMPLDVVRGAA